MGSRHFPECARAKQTQTARELGALDRSPCYSCIAGESGVAVHVRAHMRVCV